MQREDQLVEDVLKIFHNAKCLIENNIDRWQEEQLEVTQEKDNELPMIEIIPEENLNHYQ